MTSQRIFGVLLRFIEIVALACIIVDSSAFSFGFQRYHNPTFPHHSVHHKLNTILHAAETEQASEETTDQHIPSDSIHEDDSKQSTNPLTYIPPKLQNYLRDSGTLRSIVNTLTRTVLAPAFYYENPHCFPEFIRISEYPHWLATSTSRIMNNVFNVTDPANSGSEIVISPDISSRVNFQKENYGSHPKQVGQVMVKEELVGQKDLPLFIFLHGGAWGSGFGTMYRLISAPFIKRNYRAIVLDYRTYPDATMEEQMDDLIKAVDFFKARYASGGPLGRSPIVLTAHSSGAHIAMLALLKGKLSSSIDALIGMSGVYNLELAQQFEQERGLTDLSPMNPAAKGMLQECSPTWLANNCNGEIISSLPPLLLLHGENDPVAPPVYSQELHLLLTEKHGLNCHLEIFENVAHQDTVLHTCLGKGRAQSTIFEWLGQHFEFVI